MCEDMEKYDDGGGLNGENNAGRDNDDNRDKEN